MTGQWHPGFSCLGLSARIVYAGHASGADALRNGAIELEHKLAALLKAPDCH
jgi:hypothetical protein